MSYYFWLGRDGEPDKKRKTCKLTTQRILEHIESCKPEADGFITVHPKVKT